MVNSLRLAHSSTVSKSMLVAVLSSIFPWIINYNYSLSSGFVQLLIRKPPACSWVGWVTRQLLMHTNEGFVNANLESPLKNLALSVYFELGCDM